MYELPILDSLVQYNSLPHLCDIDSLNYDWYCNSEQTSVPLADWEAGPFEAGWGEQLSCSSSVITSRCCMIVRWQSISNKLSCPNTMLSNGTHGSHVHTWVALSHHADYIVAMRLNSDHLSTDSNTSMPNL